MRGQSIKATSSVFSTTQCTHSGNGWNWIVRTDKTCPVAKSYQIKQVITDRKFYNNNGMGSPAS